jgi:hypothetical protein
VICMCLASTHGAYGAEVEMLPAPAASPVDDNFVCDRPYGANSGLRINRPLSVHQKVAKNAKVDVCKTYPKNAVVVAMRCTTMEDTPPPYEPFFRCPLSGSCFGKAEFVSAARRSASSGEAQVCVEFRAGGKPQSVVIYHDLYVE